MGGAWLWAWSDIRRRWVSLVVVGLLGALAVGSVLALVAGARRAERAVDRFLDVADTPELIAFMENEPSQELVDSLVDDPRIARIERSDVVVIAPAPIVPGESGVMAVSAESSTGGFGRPRLVSGRYPDAGAADEILVNERSASTYGLRTGQRVTLRSIACYVGCPPESIGEATIVGVVRLPTDLIADPSNLGTAIGGPSFLDGRWRDRLPAGSILFVHLHDRRDTAAVVADLSVRIDDGNVTDNLAAFEVVERATGLQRNALYVAAALAGVAGFLVVAQALARHLGARGEDPPVLAAVGLTQRERWSAAVFSVAAGRGRWPCRRRGARPRGVAAAPTGDRSARRSRCRRARRHARARARMSGRPPAARGRGCALGSAMGENHRRRPGDEPALGRQSLVVGSGLATGTCHRLSVRTRAGRRPRPPSGGAHAGGACRHDGDRRRGPRGAMEHRRAGAQR